MPTPCQIPEISSASAPTGALPVFARAVPDFAGPGGDQMHDQATRYTVQALLRAGLAPDEVHRRTGVPVRTVHRIADEPVVADLDDAAARERRRVGRPGKTSVRRPSTTSSPRS